MIQFTTGASHKSTSSNIRGIRLSIQTYGKKLLQDYLCGFDDVCLETSVFISSFVVPSSNKSARKTVTLGHIKNPVIWRALWVPHAGTTQHTPTDLQPQENLSLCTSFPSSLTRCLQMHRPI